MNIGWAYRGLKSKAPLLAKNARNGAPACPATREVMSVTDEHWVGLSWAQVESPTSRKEREKWGTRGPATREVMSVTDEHWVGLSWAEVESPTSRKEREKWGTRRGAGHPRTPSRARTRGSKSVRGGKQLSSFAAVPMKVRGLRFPYNPDTHIRVTLDLQPCAGNCAARSVRSWIDDWEKEWG